MRHLRSIFPTLAALYIATPFPSFAQTRLVNPFDPNIGSINDLIDILIKIMWLVVMPLLVVALVWAGYLIVSARGDEKKLTLGKRVLIWTLVGGLIIVGAKVIKDVIIGTLQPFNAAI